MGFWYDKPMVHTGEKLLPAFCHPGQWSLPESVLKMATQKRLQFNQFCPSTNIWIACSFFSDRSPKNFVCLKIETHSTVVIENHFSDDLIFSVKVTKKQIILSICYIGKNAPRWTPLVINETYKSSSGVCCHSNRASAIDLLAKPCLHRKLSVTAQCTFHPVDI